MTRRWKTALRRLALAAWLLIVAGGVAIAALAVWLQTDAGRERVERALIGEAGERLALTLSMERMTGNLFRTVRLEKVALHDAEGRLVARADAVSARYWLYRLIFRRQIEEIVVERPVVERVPSPPPARAEATREPPGETTRLLVRTLTDHGRIVALAGPQRGAPVGERGAAASLGARSRRRGRPPRSRRRAAARPSTQKASSTARGSRSRRS